MRVDRLAVLLAMGCTAAAAQLVPTDPDWKEAEAPRPGPVKTDGLIPIEVGRTELRWGVDPASISIGGDGIVRYVVVASSASGALNAFQEGLRCTSSEVKVYARYSASGWTQDPKAEWRPLHGTSWRHSAEIAKAGACDGNAPNGPASRIVRELGTPRAWHGSR
jgi:hypothetical protein